MTVTISYRSKRGSLMKLLFAQLALLLHPLVRMVVVVEAFVRLAIASDADTFVAC